MNATLKFGVALILMSGLFFLAACSGSKNTTPVENEPVAEEVSQKPAQEAGEEEEEAESQPPTEEKPGQQQKAEAIFQQERQEASLASQKRDLLFKEHLLQADRFMQAGKYDKAETSVLRALELKPTSTLAIAKLKNILGTAGRPGGEPADIAQYIVDKRRLIRQARKARVNDRFVKANQFFSQGDYQAAQEQLEEAQTIMRFDEFQTDFGSLKSEVPALHEMVAHRLIQKRKATEEKQWSKAYQDLREKEQRDRQRKAELVRRLLMESIESFQRGDFKNTEFLAKKVLRMVPRHLKAKELLHAARAARNASWREAEYRQRRDSFQKWLEEIRETQIPYTEILSWMDADSWSALTRRRKKESAATLKLPDTEAVRAIKAKLDNETVTFDYSSEETTLSAAIKDLRARFGINMVIDREVESDKGEEPVNLALVDQNLGQALKLLLERFELAYSFQNDVLYVTTKAKALGNPIPRVYWVRDLTISLPHFKAPNLNLRPGGTGDAAKTAIFGEDLDRTTDTTIETLMDLVRENVAPGTWDNDGFSLGASAGQLVAVTTPMIHQQLERFLDDLRKFTKLTVHVEARFINVDKATLDLIGNEFRGLGGQNPGTVALLDDINNGAPDNASNGLDNSGPGLPAAASLSPSSGIFFNNNSKGDLRIRTENIFDRPLGSTLGPTGGLTLAFNIIRDVELNSLLRAVEKSQNSTVVSAPRLTIYNNQRANLTLVNQVSYVKDFDVEVAQTAFIADPLVDVVQDGLTLDVRPTVSYDRKYVTLELQPTVANLMRPIRTFETNLSGLTTPVVIELPVLDVQSAATTVKVPDDGYLVIGGFKRISTVDRRSETPILSQIPIVSFFFSTKGRSDEIQDLIIVLHVKIVDLTEQEKELVN